MFAYRPFYLLLSFSNLYFIEGHRGLHDYIAIKSLPLRIVETSRHKVSTRADSEAHKPDSGDAWLPTRRLSDPAVPEAQTAGSACILVMKPL